MNFVRENLMSRPSYSPYCGSDSCMTWERTRWNGEQFQCSGCGWVSEFPAEFIARYKQKWHPKVKP